MQKGKELNDFQRNPLDIEILSNLRFDSLEIRDTSITRVTNKNNAKLSRRRAMTVVIELEQSIENVAQVDRRAHSSWCSLSNAWRLRKSEAHKQVAEEEESFGGRSYRDVDLEERRSERLP